VTGALALLMAVHARFSAAELDQILSRTSRPVASSAGLIDSIDACDALATVLARKSCAALAASDSGNSGASRKRVIARDR
jgi:hypothetical protein